MADTQQFKRNQKSNLEKFTMKIQETNIFTAFTNTNKKKSKRKMEKKNVTLPV